MNSDQKESNQNHHELIQNQEPTDQSSSPIYPEENPTITDESGTIEPSHSADEGQSLQHRAHRQHFEKFLSDLEKLPDNEAKLQFAIDFMEASIAQSGSPHFKSFWEARSICLQLFKENISPALRAILWSKYNELSKEARRLKEILDEQSAFAVEQIEIAITALENDIAASDEHLQKIQAPEFNLASKALSERLPYYQKTQSELNLLNTQASRINALRKELIRTEMRIRQKNKFFQRLSAAGDSVFPHRKELIKQISDNFITDVDNFIQKTFKSNEAHDSLFTLREEIKALQSMAKLLTLNTHSFTHTRMHLSECWDLIKGEEKERKKERAQQKVVFKENYDNALLELQKFKEELPSLSTADASKKLEEMGNRFRNLNLGREERQSLKETFIATRQPILDKIHSDQAARQQQDLDRESQRRQKVQEIKRQIESLTSSSERMNADELTIQRDAILENITMTPMGKAEKLELERLLKPLRDLISEKKESALLTLSDDDRQSLQQLKEVLKQRKERRQAIKEQLDAYRKSSGSSGLDFEQALNYNNQLSLEKERLEKINQGIKEIEQKIAQLGIVNK